jgi:multidrug efflux pump
LSQVFTLYTTPVIYLSLDRLRVKLREWVAGMSLRKNLSADA